MGRSGTPTHGRADRRAGQGASRSSSFPAVTEPVTCAMLGGRHARPRGGTMMREVPISDEMAYLIINACRHRARQLDELTDTDAVAVDDVARALHTQQEYLSVAEHLARLFGYS